MVITGTVKNTEILTNRNGENTVRMLQVQFSNESDIQSVQYVPLSGDDNPPMIDDKVIVLSLGAAFKVAIAVDDGLTPTMGEGERKLYSRDIDGVIVAFIDLLASGAVQLIAGDKVDIYGKGIDLDGKEGAGPVTGVCTGETICHFTGSPIADVSTTVKATK